MLNGKIYKHINCRDVAFYTISCTEGRDGLHVVGYWVNVYYKPADIIQAEEGPVEITIRPDQIDKWEVYEE